MHDAQTGIASPLCQTPVEAPSGRSRGLVYTVADRTLIDAVDLDIPREGLTVIMGPNGAGKSLLLRLLHGLILPTRGTVAWDDQAPGPVVRRRQAMVFQRPVLLRRSAAANIDFVLKLHARASAARRQELLEQVGLAALGPTPARLLSGGEQQRLALARALAIEPDVLFLDEPTSNLDPASVQIIETILRACRARGMKVILVTHDIAQARRLADDVAFMHRGRVREHRPAAEFFDAPASEEARAFLEGRIVV